MADWFVRRHRCIGTADVEKWEGSEVQTRRIAGRTKNDDERRCQIHSKRVPRP